MELQEQILQLLKRVGIPLIVVIIIVAVVIVYSNYLNIKLTQLQIMQAEKDLKS